MNNKTESFTTSAWTGGFWQDRWNCCRDVMVPHMWKILADEELCHCWENFLIAAGRKEGSHRGPPFHDGDFYKWLEAAVRVKAGIEDQEWEHQFEEILDVLEAVQRPDGYIFTYDAIVRRKTGKSMNLRNDLNFEIYNMGHLMSAACVHYRMTGETRLLKMAEKAASFLKKQFASDESGEARTVICPSHYMGLADMYETMGNSEYIELLDKFIKMRNLVEGTDDNQDRIPLKEHRQILGHAVRANYLYAGLTDLYRYKREEPYREVLNAVWEDLQTKKIYISGGCGALYDGVSPYGCDDYDYIQRTHQSYGRAYELPNTAGYNETCAAIGHYLWNFRMIQTFGEGRYGDAMEKGLYNAILSGISLKGTSYFYTNALRCIEDLPYSLKWSRHREPYISSFCCPPNILRTIAETPDKFCITLDEGPAFLLYGNGRTEFTSAGGSKLCWRMESRYPFDGEIILTAEKSHISAEVPVRLRIPEWASPVTLYLNGEKSDINIDKGFAVISRHWEEGDRLRLSLGMAVDVWQSHPMVEENTNHVALTRGPILYCLETADLEVKRRITDFHYRQGSEFNAVWGEIGGIPMIVLKGTLWYQEEDSGTGGLYRKLKKSKYKKTDVTLIPYFAWDNREQGEMTVWLPLLPDQGACRFQHNSVKITHNACNH